MSELEIKANAAPVSRKRDIGIEILRMLAMLLIVCQHFLNHGGIYKNAGENVFLLHLINQLFAPSVNIFVLISGYFSLNSHFKWQKPVGLYLQVIFYLLLMPLVGAAFGQEISPESFDYAFMPIVRRVYWFFSAYLLLYFAMPFLNVLIKNISKTQHGLLVIAAFAFGYLTRFGISSVLSLNGGYSFLWFILLYFVGAYLRKYPIKIKKPFILLIYLFTVAYGMLFKYYRGEGKLFTLISTSTNYQEPLVLLAAICLLLLFSGTGGANARVGRAISFLSASTFGVYLAHEAPSFRRFLYDGVFVTSEYYGEPFAWAYVILFALLTFAAGILLDLLRRAIFYGVGRVAKIACSHIKTDTLK